MKIVGIVMGGYSSECEISLMSGNFIYSQIDRKKFSPFKVEILKDKWEVIIDETHRTPIIKENFSFLFNGKNQKFDVLVNTIHGTPGEDGLIQAYWELLNIPFTGCPTYPSALTFNKRDTSILLRTFGINTAKALYFQKGDEIDYQNIVQELGLPFFVKPNASGSSLGVSKVKSLDEFDQAIKESFLQSETTIIESFVEGREIQVGVVRYCGKIRVIGKTEVIPENDFFDFQAKYHGKSKEITPADLTENQDKLINDLSIKIYQRLNIEGFSRIDFILKDSKPYFLEINTNPGCSPSSIFPQQVEKAGLCFKNLLADLIDSKFEK